jgi:hypothetical protein
MKRNAFLALRIAIHARFVPHASPAGRGRFRRVLLQVLKLAQPMRTYPRVRAYMDARFFTFNPGRRKITFEIVAGS